MTREDQAIAEGAETASYGAWTRLEETRRDPRWALPSNDPRRRSPERRFALASELNTRASLAWAAAKAATPRSETQGGSKA
jgi:hypothetical protein